MKRRTSESLLFLSTFPNQKTATQFAQKVVKDKYAVCVNVLGSVKSFYFWKNKIQSEKEVLIIGKTTAAAFKKLKKKINELHPYDVPELIAFKISDGNSSYLKWIKDYLD